MKNHTRLMPLFLSVTFFTNLAFAQSNDKLTDNVLIPTSTYQALLKDEARRLLQSPFKVEITPVGQMLVFTFTDAKNQNENRQFGIPKTRILRLRPDLRSAEGALIISVAAIGALCGATQAIGAFYGAGTAVATFVTVFAATPAMMAGGGATLLLPFDAVNPLSIEQRADIEKELIAIVKSKDGNYSARFSSERALIKFENQIADLSNDLNKN
jgi:hypothetical protein